MPRRSAKPIAGCSRCFVVLAGLCQFAFLRRAMLRLLFRSGAFRRKGAGTFQISTVAGDWALHFNVCDVGRPDWRAIWSRVVAIEGQPVVRPVMTLTLSGDHGVWDGRAVARFMSAVKAELESA